MIIYWLCKCGSANKLSSDELPVFSSELKTRFVDVDMCKNCEKRYHFTMNLEMEPE